MPHRISRFGAPSTLGYEGPGYLAQVKRAPGAGGVHWIKKETLAYGFPGPVGGCQRVYRISSLGDFSEKVNGRPC